MTLSSWLAAASLSRKSAAAPPNSPAPEAEHLVRVLRAEPGQIYELSDNQNLYLAEIEVARKSVVTFRITEKLAPPPPPVHIALIAALFKFDRFELLVEKATELGVSVIQPFEATRTERGLGQASLKRSSRWEKIAVEASQQSRRVHLPVIAPWVRFVKALETPAEMPDYSSTKIPKSRRFFKFCPANDLSPIASLYSWDQKEVGRKKSVKARSGPVGFPVLSRERFSARKQPESPLSRSSKPPGAELVV